MKRSASDLALEDFVRNCKKTMSMKSTSAKNLLDDDDDHMINMIVDPSPANDQEVMNDLSSNVKDRDNLTPEPKGIILDTQSSISGKTPKNRENEVRGATSASSDRDQSDDEDEEEEEDIAETDATHLKRLRRMLSNRESARRSRKRKQEHQTDLELQAERMSGEKDSLYKQLTDAHQQFRNADTDNRVLKSDVEALRAKVKLAEDMLARGTLTCSLNQLVQNHLSTSPQPMPAYNLQRAPANVSPTITVHGDGDDSSYAGLMTAFGNSSATGLANLDVISNANLINDPW